MLEDEEKRILSPYAAFSIHTRGRERDEEPCDMRTCYQRDRDRILHSKSFRRMKHKTQVFLAPEGDHYRTRLTHTLEVSQIARSIARALRLNEALTEAIALGHDLGHTPFGHSGEEVLNRLCSEGFEHHKQSVRIVEVLENNGLGLNLCWEVRDGILNHQTEGNPATLEGKVVRLSDKIAYLHHDIDDAIRAGLISEEEIPLSCRKELGFNVKERLNCLIHDIINVSLDQSFIRQSAACEEAMKELRNWMFSAVYVGGRAKEEEQKAQKMLELLFGYYIEHPEEMTGEYVRLIREGNSVERIVCDYISGMTDNYAIETFQRLFVPLGWNDR